jgi:hypothetical protein
MDPHSIPLIGAKYRHKEDRLEESVTPGYRKK